LLISVLKFAACLAVISSKLRDIISHINAVLYARSYEAAMPVVLIRSCIIFKFPYYDLV